MPPKKNNQLGLKNRLLTAAAAAATIASSSFLLLGSLLLMVLVGPNLAYAQLPDNRDDELTQTAVPEFDFNNANKSMVVLLNFTALNKAEFVGVGVSYGPPHSNIGNPPLLRVQIYDYNGTIIQQFNYWHPLFALEFQEDGKEYLKILPNAVGRFVFPFDPNAALMKVSYLHHEGSNNTWAEEVTSVELRRPIPSFCDQFRNDPDCKSSDLAVVDVSTANGRQPQLPILVGNSTDVTVQTTVTNNGPDKPIDATLSSRTITTPPGSDGGVTVIPAAGATPNENGATTTKMVSSLGERQQHDRTYTIECWKPGKYNIIFESEVASLSGAVVDTNQLNNKGQMTLEVDCGYIDVCPPPPVPLGVSIEANVTEDGSPPTTIEFRAITEGGTQPQKFRWSFDDDSSNDNNYVKGDQLMTHQFTKLRQYNVTVTVTDSANGSRCQTASDNIVITISDKEAPRVIVPSHIIAEATGPEGAKVNFTVSATDIVDGPVPVDCKPASGDTFQLGPPIPVNCQATDSSNNIGYSNFTVTVQDTTPPMPTLPPPITAEATGPDGATVTYTPPPTAWDIVDGSVPVNCDPLSGSSFPVSNNATVNCYAEDSSGNRATDSFQVTVQDTTPPMPTLPPPITAEAKGPDGAVANFTVSATDIVDGNATLEEDGTTITQDQVGRDITISCNPRSGDTFELGDTTVNCYAEDSSGNRATDSFQVTVQDTTPPMPTLPPPITAEATGPEVAKVNFTVSATDIVDGNATLEEDGVLTQGDNIRGDITISCNPRSGDTFELGDTAPSAPASAATSGTVFMQSAPSTSVNCYAEDSSGNGVNGSFPVTVRDTIPPILELPNLPPIEATGPDGAEVRFLVRATDIVDGKATLGKNDILTQGDNIRGDITIDCDPASGFKLLLNETRTVNCYAQDSSGNRATDSFQVTVQDTTSPRITISPPSITLEAPPPDNTIVTSTPAVPLNPLMVRLQVNSAPASAPTSDILFVQTAPTPSATVTFFVVATDIVDGRATLGYYGPPIQDRVGRDITIRCDPASGFKLLLNETRTVNCYAQDSSGNRATDSFQVTAQDTTSPTITIPPSISNQTTIPPPPPTITIPPSISNQTTPLLPPPPPPSLAIPPSISDQPTDEEPTDEEPTDEEPTDEEPTDEEPTDEEPTDEEPTDEEPTDEEPTDEEPTDEE